MHEDSQKVLALFAALTLCSFRPIRVHLHKRAKHFEDNGCKDFSFEDWDAVAPEAAKSAVLDLPHTVFLAFIGYSATNS